MACVDVRAFVCVCVCIFNLWERSVKHNACAWGILCVLIFILCIYVFLYYGVCMLLCVPLSVRFSRALILSVEARVLGNCGVLSNRERCFSKGCQNEFVTQSVNLRRKGTVERERLSPGAHSLSDWLSHKAGVRVGELNWSMLREHAMTAKKQRNSNM